MYLRMKNLNFSQLKPISSLPRNYSELSNDVQGGNDIVFLKRSTPYVVLIDFNRWEKLVDLEREQDEMKALAEIEKSESEFASGESKMLSSLADI